MINIISGFICLVNTQGQVNQSLIMNVLLHTSTFEVIAAGRVREYD